MLSMELSFRKALGVANAFEVIFLQKTCSFASSRYFCPLRFCVVIKVRFISFNSSQEKIIEKGLNYNVV